MFGSERGQSSLLEKRVHRQVLPVGRAKVSSLRLLGTAPHSSADPPPGPGALWPTSQSPVTEPLTLISGDSLFWPHRERTQSENLILSLYMLLCDPFTGFFIFLCSTLAADSNDSKLGPTF